MFPTILRLETPVFELTYMRAFVGPGTRRARSREANCMRPITRHLVFRRNSSSITEQVSKLDNSSLVYLASCLEMNAQTRKRALLVLTEVKA